MHNMDLDQLRNQNSIDAVIAELIGHHGVPDGGGLVTRCPFHRDEHSSLWINTEQQRFGCDICRVGGDVFRFVQEFLAVDLEDACSWLATNAGLSEGSTLPTPLPTDPATGKEETPCQ